MIEMVARVLFPATQGNVVVVKVGPSSLPLTIKATLSAAVPAAIAVSVLCALLLRVPILQGLDITAKTAGNMVLTKAIMATRDSISQGDTISEPLRKSDVFPPMVTQMISVGEQTGALDEMLQKIADFYDDEVDTAVEQLTSVIEPIMIVVMGVMVGGMLIAMYLPMFKMASVMSGG